MIADELVTITVARGRLRLGSWRRRMLVDEHLEVQVGQPWPNERDVDTTLIALPTLHDVTATLAELHQLVDHSGVRTVPDYVLEYRVHIRRADVATRFVAGLTRAGYR